MILLQYFVTFGTIPVSLLHYKLLNQIKLSKKESRKGSSAFFTPSRGLKNCRPDRFSVDCYRMRKTLLLIPLHVFQKKSSSTFPDPGRVELRSIVVIHWRHSLTVPGQDCNRYCSFKLEVSWTRNYRVPLVNCVTLADTGWTPGSISHMQHFVWRTFINFARDLDWDRAG